MAGQQQHVELYRKVTLRRRLVADAGELVGGAYVPFCGDGDLAVELWATIPGLDEFWLADLNGERVERATERTGDLEVPVDVRVADCDGWPYQDTDAGVPGPLAVLDLDSYVYPYDAWRSVVNNGRLAERVVVLFTDGIRQTVKRNGKWREPDGTEHDVVPGSPEGREAYNFWWERHLRPWFTDECRRLGYVARSLRFYTRQDMVYWGGFIERGGAADDLAAPDQAQVVELRDPYKFDDARREAVLQYLRDGKRRYESARLAGVDPQTVRRAVLEDPAYAAAYQDAEMEAVEAVESSLFDAARSGNVRAMEIVLFNMDPDRWVDPRRRGQLELVGADGGTPRLELTYDDAMTRAQAVLAAAKERAAEIERGRSRHVELEAPADDDVIDVG